MSELSRTPTLAEQTLSDLMESRALNPATVEAGFMEGRYLYSQGLATGMKADKVVSAIIQQAIGRQLENGGDLFSLAIGALAGFRQAEQAQGGR